MAIWKGEKVRKFIEEPPEVKVNPNGVDLGVSEIWKISEKSEVFIHGKERKADLPKERILPEGDYYILERGLYEVRISNKVRIPLNAVALLLPRSTFNRLGILKFESALWDSGYEGFGTQTIFVPVKRLKVHKDEKWFQMIFIDSEEVEKGYDGHYQGEKPLNE